MKFESEAALAAAVVQWGTASGFDVYQEVHTRDGDIDIVMLEGRAIYAVECKLTLSPALLDQAVTRLLHAHYVICAVPEPQGRFRDRELSVPQQLFFEHYGIGLFFVKQPESCRYTIKRVKMPDGRFGHQYGEGGPIHWRSVVSQEVAPKIRRPHDLGFFDSGGRKKRTLPQARAQALAELRAFLRPEHKQLVAGAPNGSQLTPWRSTLLNVKELLARKGPMTVKEIADALHEIRTERRDRGHHYYDLRGAKAGIYRMVAEIAKEDFEKDGDKWTLKR